jgi:membrane-associated protein
MDIVGLVKKLLDIFFHLDRYLTSWTTSMGSWVYVILAVVIFCETGLVVTPFLPGDSLLFAIGALSAVDGSPLNPWFSMLLLAASGILGDAVNYSIGYRLGPRVFKREDSFFFNKKHLQKAQSFYERYGGKTIFLARFVPIIRTFAPFVAGIGKMSYRRFGLYNISGGICWVSAFVLGGYWFGNRELVKRNFHFVIVAIIFISILPGVIEFWRERRRLRAEQQSPKA